MAPQKNSTHRQLAIVLGLATVLALTWWLWLRKHEPDSPALHLSPPLTSTPIYAISRPTPQVSSTRPPDVSTRRQPDVFSALKGAREAVSARNRLEELRTALSVMPTNEAVAAICQFLDSKADAPTYLGFKVSANGLLDEAPTLRIFLLDQLARFDLAAAADYAKVILGSKDSPDEWAVALRNLARGDTTEAGRALLGRKGGEMLQYAPWQQAPSVGFLEAFDVAVYLGGTSLMPPLTEMVRRQNDPAVAHASFLTLDRLVIKDAVSTLTALRAAPDLMQGREQTRANYFARGDVGDPQQRQILENYLVDPQISPGELETFAEIFPNANFMISPNLLTQNETPSHATLVRRDAESLRVVQEWLADPKLASRRSTLEKMERRLQEFVRQANPGQ